MKIRPFLAVALLGEVAAFAAGSKTESKSSGLTVELRAFAKQKSIYNRNPVIVRFTNTTNKPIRILRPLDGSLWCWHMPHYKLDVVDEDGKQLQLSGRCGNSGLWANMKWPDDYVVTIRPTESFEKEVGINHVIPKDGECTVRFSYTYADTNTQLETVKYPDALWEGTVESKPINLTLRK